MKSKYLAIMLMAAGLMVAACNNSQKNDGKPAENNNTENVANLVDENALDEEVTPPVRTIESIREVWADQTIKVDAGTGTPGIKQFTLAFCNMYPQCETNEALRQYLTSPDAANVNEYKVDLKSHDEDYVFTYHINCTPPKGYIRCMAEIQTNRFTYGCFWNRNNGHKLFAAYIEECWETSSWDECLVMFYDYDPATGIMTPEPALTSMIEQRMKHYGSYSVSLPEDGKDITVLGFLFDEDDEMGDFDLVELKLKWDGMTFEWADGHQ